MMINDFRRRFFISLIVTVPILVLSPMIREWTNTEFVFPGSNYVLFALAAYIYSTATVFGLKGNDFFWELATLIDIMLLGHWIEMRAVLSASNALEKLAELMPNTAHVFKDGEVIDVDISELSSEDKILIKPGEKDEGDRVIGGSINGDGSLEVEVKNIGKDSYLSKVIDMVKKAQESKSKTQSLADKAAFWLTIVAINAKLLKLER